MAFLLRNQYAFFRSDNRMTTPEDKSAGSKKHYGSSAGCAKRFIKPGMEPVSVEDMDAGIRSMMHSKFGNSDVSTGDKKGHKARLEEDEPQA